MNKAEISLVLKELYKITGLRVSLHGVDYREIAAYPQRNLPFCLEVQKDSRELAMCITCDKHACARANAERDTVIYTCRHGLVEAVSPLYNFGELTGYLMMGQVLSADRADTVRAGLLRKYGDIANSICSVRSDMIESYMKIMTVCAKYLTLSNAMPHNRPTLAQLAKNYIHENFTQKISITDICENLGCSKTSLLCAFKQEWNTTVGAYITELRLSEATRMLHEGVKSIGEIARDVGFSDQSYFSKVFSAKYGMPPSTYEKAENK